jgi:hypothetical protein
MERLKKHVSIAAVLVFLICTYCFLNGNGFFKGQFGNDPFSWYFLAKGIFCSISLYLLVLILEKLSR